MGITLLPYYLTCKTCGWEEWVEEPQWLQKSLDHMEASTWKHKRTVSIGEREWKWGGRGSSTVVKQFRNLTVT